MGGYNVSRCDLLRLQSNPGQIAEDFELVDQYGEQVRLSDFCGNAVCLLLRVMVRILSLRHPVANWYNTYREQGLTVITLLSENMSRTTPSVEELAA